MHFKYDIDQRSLTQGSDNTPIKRVSLAFPDKYPLRVHFVRGRTDFVFTGSVRATLKPLNAPGEQALAAVITSVTNSSICNAVLSLNTSEMAAFVKSFASRPVVLELLAITNDGLEIASWAVEASVSRRYNGSEDVAVELPSFKATEQEAIAGDNNVKWMTPLRVWQAISAWASANFTWSNLANKPSTFPPSSHTHTLPDIKGALQTAGIDLEDT